MFKQGQHVVRAGTFAILAGIFCLFLTSWSWGENLAVPGPFSMGHSPFVEDELLVQPKAGVSEAKSSQILSEQGATEFDEIPQIRVKVIKVPAHALEKVKVALAHNPHINYVENNYFIEPMLIPNDPSFTSEWHLVKISAPQAWDVSRGSAGATIAILDSGVDPAHPDLAGKLVGGYNFRANNTDTHDVYGHGTKVAGSAAAIANNGIGVAGVAWESTIMPLVVADSTGYATWSALASATTWAADRGVRVLNMSFGSPTGSSTLQNAINYAWNKGALIFAAAGNSANSTPNFPASGQNVVAVSATASTDSLASFSSYGSWVDISAPGASILTTTNGGSYGSVSGTSFSSPIAAAVAALVIGTNPSLTNVQVEQILKENADDLGTSGFDQYFGYGRVNAYKSVLAAFDAQPLVDTTAPTASIVTPSTGATVSGTTTVNVSASDNVGVTKVQLYINGGLFATDTTGPYSFSWDTSTYSNGTYDIVAYAYDAAGNVGQSSHISASVSNAIVSLSPSDTTPPTVSFVSPAASSTIDKKVTITASATDNVGVAKIELYIDGALKSSISGSMSLTYNWNTLKVSQGAHTVVAKAYDAANNVGTTMTTLYK
ncbi:Serine protease, subtilase family [Candidatus Sulfobium mesophilum]|uniref:Serine protease, subtilase family n=1 Tax=Candidatus Sulfobium mesophilum TaxID=2016548 RepID=A0A2U3QDH9_9BACT|nr:Serine protease, subtilase family [Candidatus Sulfobium mesophilum]